MAERLGLGVHEDTHTPEVCCRCDPQRFRKPAHAQGGWISATDINPPPPRRGGRPGWLLGVLRGVDMDTVLVPGGPEPYPCPPPRGGFREVARPTSPTRWWWIYFRCIGLGAGGVHLQNMHSQVLSWIRKVRAAIYVCYGQCVCVHTISFQRNWAPPLPLPTHFTLSASREEVWLPRGFAKNIPPT